MVMMMTMMTLMRLRIMYVWLLMINDSSMDAKFDDLAERDGRMDQLTNGQTKGQTKGRTDGPTNRGTNTEAYRGVMDASKNSKNNRINF